MRYVYLLPMLEWLAATHHGGEVKTGVNGKGLKRLPATCLVAGDRGDLGGADVDENWDSLFGMVEVFARAAREVATACGFSYPEDFHRRVVDHARAMRAGTLGER